MGKDARVTTQPATQNSAQAIKRNFPYRPTAPRRFPFFYIRWDSGATRSALGRHLGMRRDCCPATSERFPPRALFLRLRKSLRGLGADSPQRVWAAPAKTSGHFEGNRDFSPIEQKQARSADKCFSTVFDPEASGLPRERPFPCPCE